MLAGKRETLLPASVAVAIIASGCSASASISLGSSELSASKMAALVTKVTKRQGLAAQHVACPSGIGFEKGRLSYCTAHYASGESSRFVVRQTNGSGNVDVHPAEMTAPAIENEIRVALRRRGIAASARCPANVAIVVGTVFNCTVSDARQTGTLPVKITDPSGGYLLGTITVKG